MKPRFLPERDHGAVEARAQDLRRDANFKLLGFVSESVYGSSGLFFNGCSVTLHNVIAHPAEHRSIRKIRGKGIGASAHMGTESASERQRILDSSLSCFGRRKSEQYAFERYWLPSRSRLDNLYAVRPLHMAL